VADEFDESVTSDDNTSLDVATEEPVAEAPQPQPTPQITEAKYFDVITLEPDGSLSHYSVDRVNVDSLEYKNAQSLQSKIGSAINAGMPSLTIYYTGYYTGRGDPCPISIETEIPIYNNDDVKTIVDRINNSRADITYKEPNLQYNNGRGVGFSFDISGKSFKQSYKYTSGGSLKARHYIGGGEGPTGGGPSAAPV